MNPTAGLDILEKTKSLDFVGIRTSDCPARSVVTIPTTLSRLPKEYNIITTIIES